MRRLNVRYWPKADMNLSARCLLLRSLLGAKRTWVDALHMSAFDPKRTSPPQSDRLSKTGVVLCLTAEGYVRRRDFIKVIAGSGAAWSLTARAQQPTMPVIGFLSASSADASRIAAFRQGLAQAGYVDGQNVTIEYRWAEDRSDRLSSMAADLARRQVMAIAATTTRAALAAKAATTTIPIVFTTVGDPVQLHLVTSLNRPGGNVTGVTQLNVEVAPKRLELLHELVPTASAMALLVNSTNPNTETNTKELQAAARTLGVELHVLNASNETDFAGVFAKLIQLRAGGLVIGADNLFASQVK
jgi:putative tryptophan/tyrosine transport system substrate-binding protein